MICPPDHKHTESLTCYLTHGCRCDNCRTNHSAKSRQRRKDIAYGRHTPMRPAIGTKRRIEALMTVGWSQKEIGRRLGWTFQRISQLRRANRVTHAVHMKVAALYRELWHMTPPTSAESVTKTKRAADSASLVGPFMWDDIDNDPAPEVPAETDEVVDEIAVDLAVAGERVSLSSPERRIALRRLSAMKFNDRDIAERLHINIRTVLRIRDELGIPASVGADNQIIIREAAA